jgi:hypothetical protein
MLSRLHSTVFVTLVLLIGCTSVSAFAPRSFQNWERSQNLLRGVQLNQRLY